MATIKTNINEGFVEKAKEHERRLYGGEIEIPCDDNCPEDCAGDHGNYELQQEWPKLFDIT